MEYTSEVERYSSYYVDYTEKTTTPSFWTSGVVFTKVYLEAGNDADVAVYQDDNSTEASKNVVTYEKNASEDVNFTNIDNVGYSYYFAFTAGYAITDKIGLGIYDNYQNQGSSSGNYGVNGYGEVSSRDQNDSSQRKTGTYFAMKSVFAQNSSYTDTVDSNKAMLQSK